MWGFRGRALESTFSKEGGTSGQKSFIAAELLGHSGVKWVWGKGQEWGTHSH